MKIKISVIALFIAAALSSCGEEENFYITNNVIEGTVYSLQSEVPGKVIFSRLERGKSFRKGETLLVIDTALVHNEKEIIRANLEALEKKRESLVSRKASVRANVVYLKEQYGKWKNLAEKQAGPEQRADDLKHQYDLAKLQLKEVDAQLRAIPSERKVLTAKLSSVEETLKKHIITAPVSGTIIDKFIHEGEIVKPGIPFAQMSDLSHLHVYLYWPIDMIGNFAIDDPVDLYIEGSDTPFKGRISWISPVSEFTPKIVQSRENRAQLVYKVRIEADNPDGKLKLGQPVEIRLPWQERDE